MTPEMETLRTNNDTTHISKKINFQKSKVKKSLKKPRLFGHAIRTNDQNIKRLDTSILTKMDIWICSFKWTNSNQGLYKALVVTNKDIENTLKRNSTIYFIYNQAKIFQVPKIWLKHSVVKLKEKLTSKLEKIDSCSKTIST